MEPSNDATGRLHDAVDRRTRYRDTRVGGQP